MKTLELRKNFPLALPETDFKHATNGQDSHTKTQVVLTYLDEALQVNFYCENNPFVHENIYTEHNDALWNQEVFEIFICDTSTYPHKYLELEINPNNALFAGWIENGTMEKPDSCTFLDIGQSGIMHYAAMGQSSWWGFFKIPLSLFEKNSKTFRCNLFRIISTQSHPVAGWEGSPADCDYLCYIPTMSGDSPRFHRPEVFASLILLDKNT